MVKLLTIRAFVSNAFCQYFSNIGQNFSRKIGPSSKAFSEYLPKECDATIFLAPTSAIEIEKTVSKFRPKKSSGYDGISNILLKKIINIISIPLSVVFNKSLNNGIFPDKIKIAEIIPIYKLKGQKDDLSSYRPISLLPVISKVLEKIVYNRVYWFLCKKQLLYHSQYGFRHNHSTIDAVLELIGQIIKGFDRGEYTLAVYLDLSKAFDTLSHDTILKKLMKFGIRGKPLSWFES